MDIIGNANRMGILHRIEHGFVRPALRHMRPAKRIVLGGVTVEYKSELDGGGMAFGQDFIPFLRSRGMPKQPRLFEWCAGPAFIGFSMLGHGLCETLCLADINPAAVNRCRNTVKLNHLEDRVSVYHSNNLRSIPASERWNLVVSNGPTSSISTKAIFARTIRIGRSTGNFSTRSILILPTMA